MTYRSLHYHRSPGGRSKSIWCVSRADEFALFCNADVHHWFDNTGYWALRNSAHDVLGSKGERLALFPAKAAAADDWHGYPVALSPMRRPSVDLAAAWVHAGAVSFAVGEKIKRGKL
jgi:hypothetical protein